MIDPTKLTDNDKNRIVIYRGVEGTPPEYAQIVKWSDKRVWIVMNGDNQLTEVYPQEVTFKE
jgi:hypothetical protein